MVKRTITSVIMGIGALTWGPAGYALTETIVYEQPAAGGGVRVTANYLWDSRSINSFTRTTSVSDPCFLNGVAKPWTNCIGGQTIRIRIGTSRDGGEVYDSPYVMYGTSGVPTTSAELLTFINSHIPSVTWTVPNYAQTNLHTTVFFGQGNRLRNNLGQLITRGQQNPNCTFTMPAVNIDFGSVVGEEGFGAEVRTTTAEITCTVPMDVKIRAGGVTSSNPLHQIKATVDGAEEVTYNNIINKQIDIAVSLTWGGSGGGNQYVEIDGGTGKTAGLISGSAIIIIEVP
ncbi:hypothetical protein [Enterobacter cloacae]|uniref:hypothetical protein n=1 Tax=Enterobacter cloacae TaxID=550 RepID=UPI00101AFDF6|nr:hypothetical protein [Enterobacter cloacae]QBC03383.1 hypothetical protein EWI30_15385 [Enterobacter cloacae]